jgi:hypothetical protein
VRRALLCGRRNGDRLRALIAQSKHGQANACRRTSEKNLCSSASGEGIQLCDARLLWSRRSAGRKTNEEPLFPPTEMRSFVQELFESGAAKSLEWMENSGGGRRPRPCERYPC